mgnify:CR=1 FL=1
MRRSWGNHGTIVVEVVVSCICFVFNEVVVTELLLKSQGKEAVLLGGRIAFDNGNDQNVWLVSA